MQRTVLWVIICIFGCLSLACAQEENTSAEDLYARYCRGCHSSAITCLELGQDRTYWSTTLKRMFKKDNTPIDAEDLQILTDFLTSADPGAKPVCN